MSQPERPQARRTLARQPPPPGIYASKYDPELGGAICRRIAAGESLASICRADPSMPTEKTVWNWARAHADFAAMKRHAQETARARALIERDADLAARAVVPAGMRRRRAWNAGLDGYFLEHMTAWRIIRELEAGRTLTEVCREGWAPCAGTFFNWLKRYPALRGAYAEAKGIAGEVLVETAREDAPWLGTEAASERNLRRALRAAERRASQLASVRYAAAAGPQGLRVVVVEPGQPEGEGRVVYDEVRRGGSAPSTASRSPSPAPPGAGEDR